MSIRKVTRRLLVCTVSKHLGLMTAIGRLLAKPDFRVIALRWEPQHYPSPGRNRDSNQEEIHLGCGMFLLPALLFTSQHDFRDFIIGTAIFGVVVAASSLKFNVSGGLVSGIDPSHIGKGQTIGLAMLVLLYAPVTDRRWRAFILLVCIPFLAIGLVSAETQNAPHKASARAKGIAVPIYSPADILEARKKGRELARDLGFSPTDCTLIATAISELARNIVLYAVSGEIHISSASNSAVDGLGHDGEACAAAQLAADALQEYAGLRPLVTLPEDCHEKLRGSRGAIVSVALLNASEDAMTWLGVGSVEGRLLRAQRTGAAPAGKAGETLLLRAGLIGHQLPRLAADTVPLSSGDLLVFATDGIRPEFLNDIRGGDPPQRIAQSILDHYGLDSDDALVLVVRYLHDRELVH